VAKIAARAGGDSEIARGKLLGLLLGKRSGAPPQKGVELRSMSLPGKRQTTQKSQVEWRPTKAWSNKLDIVSVANDRRPACVRTYFSVPDQLSGFSTAESHETMAPPKSARTQELNRSVSPKVDCRRRGGDASARGPSNASSRSASPDAKLDASQSNASARARSLTPPRRIDFNDAGFKESHTERRSRFVWGKDRPSLKDFVKHNKTWDNTLHDSSVVNAVKSSYARHYFTDFHERPVKKEHLRRMTERNPSGMSRVRSFC